MGRNNGDFDDAVGHSRNGEKIFYSLRQEMPPMQKTQLEQVISTSSEGSKAYMAKQRGREGGWAGHMPGRMDPQSRMSGEIARLRASGQYEGGTPILKKAPSKRFRPKGQG